MTDDDKENLMKRLEEQYTNTGTSPVSDDVYDALARSMGRKVVGASCSTHETVRHDTPMLSLDNLMTTVTPDGQFDQSEYHKWVTLMLSACPEVVSANWVVEPKLDGLALSARYQGGMLVVGALRGDKHEGRNVTTLMADSGLLHTQIEDTRDIEVRGELFIPETVFQNFNRELKRQGNVGYKTARNAIAGWVFNSNVEVLRELARFVVYEVIGVGGDHLANKAHIASLGISVSKTLKVFSMSTYDDPTACFDKWAKQRVGDDEYPRWDGVVYKLQMHADRRMLEDKLDRSNGAENTSPAWAIAHKFPAEEAITKVVEIFFSTGMDGQVTPRARVEPVNLGGTTVTKCTMHSWQRYQALGVCVGDTVVVSRRGDVIPHLEYVLLAEGSRSAINEEIHCPSCGTRLEVNGAHIFCNNVSDCSAQVVRRIERFVSRDAMNVDDIGPERIQLLLTGNVLPNGISDFFASTFEETAGVALSSTVVAAKIAKAFKQRRINGVSLSRYLYAHCLPHIGRSLAGDLAKGFGDVESLLQASANEISRVCGFKDNRGEAVYTAIHGQFLTQHLLMRSHGLLLLPEAPFTHTVALTGTFSGGKRRITDMLAAKGIRVASSLNKSCDALVVGDAPGDKVAKAKRLGVPTWTEAEALEFADSL